MFQEFKQFILRGNVIDLAVAVVIAGAFGAVIASCVADLLTPLIAAIFGKPDFSSLTFEINGSPFFYGSFINSLITFITIAAAVFFFVVKPMNLLIQRAHSEPPADPTTKRCPECVSEVPVEATRCAFCTTQLTAAA